MKVKITLKEGRQYDPISINYCKATTLLRNFSPWAYSVGVYGWRCDYYEIDGNIICMGYNPIGRKVDPAILHKYESQAAAMLNENGISSEEYQAREQQVTELLKQFIKEVTK